MDNSRAPKKRYGNSVDGFVSGRSQRPQPGPNLRAFDQYYKAQRPGVASTNRRKVDGFSSPDGFRPIVAPAIHQPGVSRQPLEITDAFDGQQKSHNDVQKKVEELKDVKSKKSRRRLFRRNKHDKAYAKVHKHPKLRIGMRVGAALGALILLVGAGLILRTYLAGRNIFKGGGNSVVLNNQEVDPSLLRGEGDGRVNTLILGKGGEEQQSGPDLTDTIIIASIDPLAKEATLLSIPRDFWVKSPSGYQSKVNEVYANAKMAVLNEYPYAQRSSAAAKEKAEKAGLEALKKTLSDALGVPIHYHAMIDFAGFKKAIDTVGGIDITVTEDMAVSEYMWIGGKYYNLNVKPGKQHFDGQKALAFSRSRKTSLRGDFARSERQRAVILGLKDKVFSTGTLANPLKLNQLISDFGNQIVTDFSVNEIMRVYELTKDIPGNKVTSAGLDKYVIGDMINGLSVQVPKTGTFEYKEIQTYVRSIMRDAFLRSEDAKVIVLNGTNTAGLATKKSDELKSFGYNVISVGDAPTKAYTDTLLIDLRNGEKKYTLNYLQKRLGVTATGALPDANIASTGADFVIILGSK